MAIFDFSPGATDVTAVANLISAIINRRTALEIDQSDYAKRQLANLEEIEAPFMFLIRKWNKLIGVTPAGEQPHA